MPTKRVTPVDRALAVGYLRVSTDEQQLGPAGQEQALQRWCAQQGVRLAAVHLDQGVSGGASPDRRPALLAALADLRLHRAGVLLVAKRDRLARDVTVAALIERLAEREGARVMAADGGGNGDAPEHQLLKGILDVFSMHERAVIRARTKTALAVKRGRNERIGGIPFGFKLADDRVHLVEDAAEQEILAEMVSLRASGYSLRSIVAALNTRGRPARGTCWRITTIARLLKRAEAASATTSSSS